MSRVFVILKPNLVYFGVHEKNEPWGCEGRLAQLFEKYFHVLRVDFRTQRGFIRQNLEELCRHYDLCFLQNGRGFPRDLLTKISLPTCFFAIGGPLRLTRNNREIIRLICPRLVLADTLNTHNYCKKRHLRCRFVATAYDDRYYRYRRRAKEYDITFVGRLSSRRRRLLKELRQAAPDLRFYIGTDYDPSRVNDIYNASKIVLHVMQDDLRYVPTRLFETLPVDAAFLSEDLGAETRSLAASVLQSIRQFKYNSIQDAADQARDLLNGDRWRQLSDHGRSIAESHTWLHRVDDFVNDMLNLVGQRQK